MLVEWDAFGQSMRLLGLCEEDDVITLIDEVSLFNEPYHLVRFCYLLASPT
jgi:hypothetical protein